MKRWMLLMLVMSVAMVPGITGAQVNAGGGSISLLAHIDFVGRYSADDKDEHWKGYETYNTEFAVIGLAGQIGDYVSWVLTQELAFIGTNASVQSARSNWDVNFGQGGAGGSVLGQRNDTDANLLDARVNFHLGENFMISAGRFLPPTSMTWSPHLMKVMHSINYPLINGSGFQVGGTKTAPGLAPGLMIPLPLYQSGVMLTAMYQGISLQVGSFNGSNIIGGHMAITPFGVANTMDIDKSKGTAVKLAVDVEGVHFGGWYYAEEAHVELYNPSNVDAPLPIIPDPPGGAKAGSIRDDAHIVQWGLEFAFNSEIFFAQAQYLNTHLDMKDRHVSNIFQYGYYGLAGVHLSPQLDLVGRYDYMDYDEDDTLATDDCDEESAALVGIHYLVNENVTVGLEYTWRWIENWDPNSNELAVIAELNLF